MTDPLPDPKPATEAGRGLVLGGCRLERILGTGGMGEVWLARQLSLDRPVAVKILSPRLARDANYVHQFQREATLAARINSRFVVQTFDAGFEQRFAYVVMELLEGVTLEQRVRTLGALREASALNLLLHAAKGLAAAHQLGLVHRDIKPANVFVQKKGPAKILDFGLVQAQGEPSGLTEAGTVMGTPHYMSPEQCAGLSATPLSDLYSLGASLYMALTKRPPFTAESSIAVMRMQLDEAPRPLRELRPEISPETEALVLRLLAKEPKERPPSAADLAREAEARIRVLAGSPAGGTVIEQQPAPPGVPATQKNPQRRLVLAGAGAVALLALAALFLWPPRRQPTFGAFETRTVTTRFSTLEARIVPLDTASGPGGVLEIVIKPRPGLFLSGAHGQGHGKHRVAEYGIDLDPSPPIKTEVAELDLPEIRSERNIRVRLSLDARARRGRFPIRIVHRYQAGEPGGVLFPPDKMELTIEAILE